MPVVAAGQDAELVVEAARVERGGETSNLIDHWIARTGGDVEVRRRAGVCGVEFLEDVACLPGWTLVGSEDAA